VCTDHCCSTELNECKLTDLTRMVSVHCHLPIIHFYSTETAITARYADWCTVKMRRGCSTVCRVIMLLCNGCLKWSSCVPTAWLVVSVGLKIWNDVHMYVRLFQGNKYLPFRSVLNASRCRTNELVDNMMYRCEVQTLTRITT